jgi:tetratricopeptide (TPR) repeat protein
LVVVCHLENRDLKNIIYILTLLFGLTNCKEQTQDDRAVCGSCDVEEQMRRASDELAKFHQVIIAFYDQIEAKPKKVVEETQLLIQNIKAEADTNNVRWNKLGALYDLRAETFYKVGEYQKSIDEIYNAAKNNQETLGGKFLFGDNDFIHLACNYVKLQDLKAAKQYLDSAEKGWYITDFIWANYYEVVNKKEDAFKVYRKILKQDERDHYYFYKDAQDRIDELAKQNPKLLTELFYPSDRPDNEICETDNDRRTKIFELIGNLTEVENCEECNVILIHQEPKHTESSKYWIKVGHDNGMNLVSQFNFFVDTLTCEITYLDTDTDEQITLTEWRKRK